jgi:ABC-2 type transport system permease protein
MMATRTDRELQGEFVGRIGPRLHFAERSLRDRQRSITSWGVGIVVYLGLIVAFWPSIRGSSEMANAIQNYPDAMKEFFGGAAAFDYTKPGGFLNAQLFSLMAPLLLGAFAMSYGASTVAGEEGSGQLDLVLALPVRRARVIAEKAVAVALAVSALTALAIAVVLAAGAAVSLDVFVINVIAACVGSGLVALVHGALAIALGAWTGNRAVALGVSAAAFAGGYLLQALSGLVDALKPVRALSALYHANGTVPINNGFPIWHYVLLAAVAVGLAVIAVPMFERRDLRA